MVVLMLNFKFPLTISYSQQSVLYHRRRRNQYTIQLMSRNCEQRQSQGARTSPTRQLPYNTNAPTLCPVLLASQMDPGHRKPQLMTFARRYIEA